MASFLILWMLSELLSLNIHGTYNKNILPESLIVKNQLILCVFTAPIKLPWTKQSDLIFAPSTLNNESIHAILCVYNKICVNNKILVETNIMKDSNESEILGICFRECIVYELFAMCFNIKIKLSTKLLGSSEGSSDEFSSPLQYIQSIYGIITIKPPSEWNPIFNLSFDDFTFSTKIQPLHLLEKRIGGIVTSENGFIQFQNENNIKFMHLNTFMKPLNHNCYGN